MGIYSRVEQNPRFRELVRKRTRFAWQLSILMIAIYFAFILTVAFIPQVLGAPIGGGVMTVGIPIGILIIISAFILTAIYVRRANSEFDADTVQIVRESQT